MLNKIFFFFFCKDIRRVTIYISYPRSGSLNFHLSVCRKLKTKKPVKSKCYFAELAACTIA